MGAGFINNKTKVKRIILILIVILIITTGVGFFVYYHNTHKPKPTPATELQGSQGSSSNDQTSQSNDQPATTPTSASKVTPSAVPAAPKPPTFTKSSGNTGPIPSGVTVDFTCMSEVNTECSIILDSNGKQIILGPSKIADNNRGQYAVDFYWTSIKGSYKITAQAKNSQGGISTSAVQTLVVQ